MVDIDLDWPEARVAASHILPPTRTFGRAGAHESHRVYRVTDTIPKTTRYKIGGDGDDRSVAELLSTGAQSLVPPSLHASGERRQWYQERPAAEVEGSTLIEGVADSTTAALIARNWPGPGARHDYVLAATGYVARHLSQDRAERTMEAAIAASGDEEANGRLRDVRDTLEKVAADTPTTGGPTLDELAPGVVDQLQRWHRWSSKRNIEYRRRPISSQASGAPAFNLTDLGNAERLVARHGDDLRYCHSWGKWLAWDGRRWAVDATGEVERQAVETVASIYTEAANADDKDERKAIARHAERSEARRAIDAMIALGRSRPGVPIKPDDLDADPWALNTASGTVDLRTGDLRAHARSNLITKMIPVEYDLDAQAPRFARFLREIFDGDEDLIAFVQRFAGYSLTGSTDERAFAILHGSGKNGKTTLVELLQDVMGDYARNTDTETVLRKRHAGVGNDVAALKGARFVSAAEVEQGRALAESKVKNLTGSDTVTARFLFAEPFDFRPEFKVWLSTNNKPVIHGTDDAIWDRIRLIPFTRRFAGTQADHALPRKLRTELPGILAWMVAGCLQWQRVGLGEPDKVTAATTGYRAEMDALAAFFEERCVIHPRAEVPATQLYKAYQEWCADSGESDESQRRFGGRLQERGFENFRYTAGPNKQRKGWRGIGLRDDRHDHDPGGGDPPNPSDRVNDQTRTKVNNNDQDAQNAPDSAGEGSPGEQSAYEGSPGDLPIDRENPANDGGTGERSERNFHVQKPMEPYVERLSEEGSLRSLRSPEDEDTRQENGHSKADSETIATSSLPRSHDTSYATVADFFSNPPDWFVSQLEVYRRNPTRHLPPLCAAVAAEVLGDGLRGDEVCEAVERELA
jgi:putative DNA primase/helicase